MNYRVFSVKGKNPKTNRQKTSTVTLPLSVQPTEESILDSLEGSLVPPLEWAEIPHDPPTEAQLSYARDLGVSIPKNATKWDVSALLDKNLNKDSEPNPELLQFADGRKLEFSEYIGKKALYNLIFSSFSNKDRIAFFCFSIYRYLTEDRHANLDTSPHRELFYSFADMHENSAKFLDKLNCYSGQQLRFFGKLKVETDDGSFIASGGDTQNYAYKTAKAFLAKHFDIPGSNSKTIVGTRDSDDRRASPETPVENHDNAPLPPNSITPIPESVKKREDASPADAKLGCGCLIVIAVSIFSVAWWYFK